MSLAPHAIPLPPGEGGRRPGEGALPPSLVLLAALMAGPAFAQVEPGPLEVLIRADAAVLVDGVQVDNEELAHRADLVFLKDPDRRVVITIEHATSPNRIFQVIDLLKLHGAHRFALAQSSDPPEEIDAGPIGTPDLDAGAETPDAGEPDAGSEPADAGSGVASDVTPYVEPPHEDFHKLVEANGYLNLRGTYSRSRVHGLIATDQMPQLGAQAELNAQVKVTYSPKRFAYFDVSLIPQAGWDYRGEDASGKEVSVDSSNNAAAQPVASLNEVYLLHEVVPQLNLLVGKKRIVWGSGQAYNPTDLLNLRKDPTDPTFLRTGAWMARVEVPVENITLTALFAPQVTEQLNGLPYQFLEYPSWDRKDNQLHYLTALRAYALVADADVNLMLYFSNRYNDAFERKVRFGGSFSRYFFKDYELHAEVLVQNGSSRDYVNGSCVANVMQAIGCAVSHQDLLSKPRLNDGVIYPKVLVGTRRQFDDDSFVSLEYLYQADGYSQSQFQDFVNAADLIHQARALGLPVGAIPGAANFGQPAASTDGVPQRFSFDPLRQHYLFATYNKPRIKDDFTAQLVLIADLSDLSTLWVPSLAWSATEWLTITALGFIPAPGPSGLAATRVSNGAHVSEYTFIPMDYRFFLEARLFY